MHKKARSVIRGGIDNSKSELHSYRDSVSGSIRRTLLSRTSKTCEESRMCCLLLCGARQCGLFRPAVAEASAFLIDSYKDARCLHQLVEVEFFILILNRRTFSDALLFALFKLLADVCL